MKWFHRHEFDPEKWKLIVQGKGYANGVKNLPTEVVWIYSNTCKTCGDLVFRKEEM